MTDDREWFEELVKSIYKEFNANIILMINAGTDEEEEITTADLGGEFPDESVNYEICGFFCPECDEPIYYEDWWHNEETHHWNRCPVCHVAIR